MFEQSILTCTTLVNERGKTMKIYFRRPDWGGEKKKKKVMIDDAQCSKKLK